MGDENVTEAELEKALESLRSDFNSKLDGRVSIGEFERRYAMLDSNDARMTDRIDALTDRVVKLEVKLDTVVTKVNDIDKTLGILVSRFDGFLREVNAASRRNLVVIGILVTAAEALIQLLHL